MGFLQPQSGTRVNWSSPLTRSLTFLTDSDFKDLVTNTYPVLSGATPPTKILNEKGKGYTFSGTNTNTGYLNYGPDVARTLLTGAGTFLIMLNISDVSVNQSIAGKSDTNSSQGWILECVSGGLLRSKLVASGNNPQIDSVSGALVSGKWHVIAITFDGNVPLIGGAQGYRMYIDGIDATAAINAGVGTHDSNATQPFTIGAMINYPDSAARDFNGKINLSAGWDRKLNSDEIKSLSDNPWQLFATSGSKFTLQPFKLATSGTTALKNHTNYNTNHLVDIDYRNPNSKGIASILIPQRSGLIWDPVRKVSVGVNTNYSSNITFKETPYGLGFVEPNYGDSLSLNNGQYQAEGRKPIGFLISFWYNDDTITNPNDMYLFCTHPGSATALSNNQHSGIFYRNTAGEKQFVMESFTDQIFISGLTKGFHTMAIWRSEGNFAQFILDGKIVGTGTSNPTGGTFYFSQFLPTTSFQESPSIKGILYVTMKMCFDLPFNLTNGTGNGIANITPSVEKLLSLSKNPYQIFKAPNSRVLQPTATSFPVYYLSA